MDSTQRQADINGDLLTTQGEYANRALSLQVPTSKK